MKRGDFYVHSILESFLNPAKKKMHSTMLVNRSTPLKIKIPNTQRNPSNFTGLRSPMVNSTVKAIKAKR